MAIPAAEGREGVDEWWPFGCGKFSWHRKGWLGQSEAVPQWLSLWGFAALQPQPPNAGDCGENLPHPAPLVNC